MSRAPSGRLATSEKGTLDLSHFSGMTGPEFDGEEVLLGLGRSRGSASMGGVDMTMAHRVSPNALRVVGEVSESRGDNGQDGLNMTDVLSGIASEGLIHERPGEKEDAELLTPRRHALQVFCKRITPETKHFSSSQTSFYCFLDYCMPMISHVGGF